MDLSNNTLIVIITVQLVIVVTLSILLSACKNKEKFCVCTGITKRNVDLPKLKDLYNSGERTEYTNFAAIQDENGGAKWPKISGRGYNVPFSEYTTPTPKCG